MNSSYVVIPADKAKELAKKALKRVKTSRQRHLKEHLERRVKKINGSWWRKLFKVTPTTADEVYQRERGRGAFCCTIDEIEQMYYWRTEDLADQILKATAIGGDPLHLRLEDAELL